MHSTSTTTNFLLLTERNSNHWCFSFALIGLPLVVLIGITLHAYSYQYCKKNFGEDRQLALSFWFCLQTERLKIATFRSIFAHASKVRTGLASSHAKALFAEAYPTKTKNFPSFSGKRILRYFMKP